MNYAAVFNATYYADKYPDLKQAFGYDKDKLLEHFINNGIKQGRQASPLFDVNFYANKYADLKKAFSNNLEAYVLHYINNGYKQKRVGSPLREKYMSTTTYFKGVNYSLVYDGLYYVETYPDLKKAFKYDWNKLIEHFVTSGMKEGRCASPLFQLQCYKANYPDLQNTFRNYNDKYYLHYMNYGYKENRIANDFINNNNREEDNKYKYESKTGTIEIFKEKYCNVNVYAAHLQFTDYTRFKTFYHPSATTSHAAALTGAVFCINGSAAKINGSGQMHDGVVPDFSINKVCTPGLYNQKTGMIIQGFGSKYANMRLTDIFKQGIATDTFGFGPAYLVNGKVGSNNGGSRRPRTFIGTNEKPGDIWLVVSEGDAINGNGPGLTGYECAKYLQSKGCTLGYPLDGGGSSTMWFKGELINTPSEKGKERGYIGDFMYFK